MIKVKTFKGFAQNLDSDYDNMVSPFIERIINQDYKITHKETNIYVVQNCAYYFISIIFEK